MSNIKIDEICSWYEPEVQDNLRRLLCHGHLGGTGKMVILPVDQGFEHGPARSFAKNPDAYDPEYHFQLAIKAGCSAYAAPYGFLKYGCEQYASVLPLILKLNNSDSLFSSKNPIPSLTSSVEDAVKMNCVGVGFTIYPGSSHYKSMYEEVKELSWEARKKGLLVVIWSYPRGEGLMKEGETALDVVAYAAHIAAQLGAHIIKVKPPTGHIGLKAAEETYANYVLPSLYDKENSDSDKKEKLGFVVSQLVENFKKKTGASQEGMSLESKLELLRGTSLRARTRHILESAFNGKRIVIFSGGVAKAREEVLAEIKELATGGSFGSILGRNAFQRPVNEAVSLLKEVMEIYKMSGFK